MNSNKTYLFNILIGLILVTSISLQGCDSPECCGLGCGILGGKQSASCGSSSRPQTTPQPLVGFAGPGDIAVTKSGDYVVLDSGHVYVDRVSGDRTIISRWAVFKEDEIAKGPRLGAVAIAITLDEDYVSYGWEGVGLVDHITGNRKILSRNKKGNGPNNFRPEGIALTTDGDFMVLDSHLLAVIYVDQFTGDRTILSDNNTGSGPGFMFPKSIATLIDGDFVVLDVGLNAVVHVDQFTGDRTILSDDLIGSGPSFLSAEDIAVTNDGDIVVIDDGLDAVIRVDQFTGDRAIISDEVTGMGPVFLRPRYIAVTNEGNLVVSDTEKGFNALVLVNWITGDRTIISDSNTGIGP